MRMFKMKWEDKRKMLKERFVKLKKKNKNNHNNNIYCHGKVVQWMYEWMYKYLECYHFHISLLFSFFICAFVL